MNDHLNNSPNYMKRYSCRSFSDEPVSKETVSALLDAALAAPSAGNMQPWRFHVVISPDIRQGLSRAAYGQAFVADAPVVIVVSAVPDESAVRYGERGRSLYCIQDTAAAVQNILLACTDLGLGSCWVGAFDESQVSGILSLGPGIRPVAMVPVGFAAQPREPRSRKPPEDIVTYV